MRIPVRAAIVSSVSRPVAVWSGRRAGLRALAAVVGAVCAVAGLAGPARAAPGADATVEETTFTVAANAAGADVARCPAGTRVVGGGVGTTAATVGSQVQVSGPLDETGLTANTVDGDIARSWYGNVKNLGVERTYKVFALCSASSDATVEETTFTVAANTAGNVAGADVARCPAGTRVVGGGVGTTAATGTVGSQVQVSGPLDETGLTANTVDGDIARSWYGNVYNLGGDRTYKVFALCSASSDATVEETTFTPAAFAAGADVARCPAGTRVVGGGVGTTAATVGSQVQVSGPLDETGLTANTVDGDIARKWYANVNNLDGDRTYKVLALCAADDVPPGPAPALPGPGPGPGGGGGPDTTKPVLGALLMSSSVFQAAGSGPAFTARVGTKVSFTLSEPGSVKFTVQRKTRGRRVAGRCRPQTTANRTKPACTRWVNVRGSFTVPAKKGANKFTFRGRIGGRKLKPASYRLNGRATDKAGNKSALKRKSFRIVR